MMCLVMKPTQWLKQYARASRSWVMLSIGFGLASGGLLIVQASMIAHIIDAVFIHHQPLSNHYHVVLILCLAIVLRALLAYGREWVGYRAGEQARQTVRDTLLAKMTCLGPVRLKAHTSGELSTLMLEHVEALQGYYANYLPQMILAVLLPLVIVACVFPLSWLAGVILLVTMPLIPLFMALVGMGAAALQQKHFESLTRMSAHFLDVLQGLSTLKYFGRAKAMLSTVERVSEEYRQHTMSVLYVAFLSSGVLEFFAALSVALLATFLGLAFLGHIHIGYAGHLTLATGLFILILAPEFYLPLRELNTHYHTRAEAIGAAKALQEFLAIPMPEAEGGVLEFVPRHIRLDAVGLQYAEQKMPVLQKTYYTFEVGKSYALLGPSGIGKSSILHMLLGFVAPTEGTIWLGEMPLKQIDRQSWLRHVAYLGQQARLSAGSIRDNLLMGNPDATDTQLLRALKAAQADVFVQALPDGLDTVIFEQRQGISGGQAQRIALARMLLKSAPIWFLDEPTASLDAVHAEALMHTIAEQSKGKLVVIVSHDPRLVAWVDQVWNLGAQ